MLFPSWGFALLVALLLPIHYLVPKRAQWLVLLAANLVFYSFAGLWAMGFLLLTVASVYGTGLLLDRNLTRQKQTIEQHRAEWSKEQRKALRQTCERQRKGLVALCLVLNFGILFCMKYLGGMLRPFAPELADRIVLTMGVSFYTFSTVSYLLDVHRGTIPVEKNPLRLLLFSSFFPLLVQGPISRYGELGKTLFAEKTFSLRPFLRGLLRVAWGYWKKIVIADRLLVAIKVLVADPVTYSGTFVFVGMLLYAACLYADFTGGIDITIGIGEMLGIRITENFRRPYFSKSISEYWRRWHITLGAWFREYVYYPLSVSKPMRSLSRATRPLGVGVSRRVPVYLATLLVWALTGMWHGNSLNFLVWGLLNGILILLSEECAPWYDRFHQRFPTLRSTVVYRIFMVVRTVLLLSVLRMFDCYATVGETVRAFGSMFTTFHSPSVVWQGLLSLGLAPSDYLIACFGVVVLAVVSLLQRKGSIRDRILDRPLWCVTAVLGVIILSLLVFGWYGFGFDAGQFLYNRF